MSRFMAIPVSLSCLLVASCIPPPEPEASPPEVVTLTIQASVTAVNPVTHLPETLSGTVGGDWTGTYSEQILQTFFDDAGNLTGATSLSHFTFDPPHEGTISSYNFAESVTPILQLDANQQPVLDGQGNPIVIGLRTSATGSLFDGTETLAGVFGNLQTQTELSFTGGERGLGQVTSSVSLLTTRTDADAD